MAIGTQGFGFLLELERQGFDVGVPAFYRTGAVEHRVLDPADATAVIHYVVGPRNIERWRDTSGAVEVAYYEPRTDAQVARYEQLHDEVAESFRRAGLDELADGLDGNLLVTALDQRTTDTQAATIQDMMSLGLPGAVFVAPLDVQPAD
jgi:hypothetical protein